ncbi:MAG: putative ABC transport system permease protein, partial [Alphaproteobacteria bacterium]
MTRTGLIGDFMTALRFARRDLRGGFHGFRVMLACLALGVAAIAGIGSLTAAVRDGLARDARTLLGGDLDIRITSRPASAEQLAWFRDQADVSAMARMRAMAARGDGGAVAGRTRALIELKAVDHAYPLLGKVLLSPSLPLNQALARANNGRFGTV